MIRIGFFYNFSESWMGGVNYIKNLLFALSTLSERKIEPIVFSSSPKVLEQLARFATIIKTPSPPSFLPFKIINRCECELTGSSRLYNNLVRKHKIDIVSHSGLFGRFLPCRSINWIPDFQHFKMPNLFPPPIKLRRDIQYFRIIKKSTRIMLSSWAAFLDLSEFAPAYRSKAKVIHFISQPDTHVFSIPPQTLKNEIAERFGITDEFFYLPNQFWTHKNHLAVWRAVKYLKDSGVEVKVVCTGFTEDYRKQGYLRSLLAYITDNHLSENIKILGLVEYKYVMSLFRNAISILNPSLFEGWSSTVEEAKSLGAHCILSDIPVHQEQDAPDAWYFDPRDHIALAQLLGQRWEERRDIRQLDFGEKESDALHARTSEFARAYQSLAIETMDAN